MYSAVSFMTHRMKAYFQTLVFAKNAEGMKEHRQAVECKARNPCYTHIRQQNPEAGDGYVSLIIRRTFGTQLLCDT